MLADVVACNDGRGGSDTALYDNFCYVGGLEGGEW